MLPATKKITPIASCSVSLSPLASHLANRLAANPVVCQRDALHCASRESVHCAPRETLPRNCRPQWSLAQSCFAQICLAQTIRVQSCREAAAPGGIVASSCSFLFRCSALTDSVAIFFWRRSFDSVLTIFHRFRIRQRWVDVCWDRGPIVAPTRLVIMKQRTGVTKGQERRRPGWVMDFPAHRKNAVEFEIVDCAHPCRDACH